MKLNDSEKLKIDEATHKTRASTSVAACITHVYFHGMKLVYNLAYRYMVHDLTRIYCQAKRFFNTLNVHHLYSYVLTYYCNKDVPD